MKSIIFVHDFTDPDDPQGRTYKQINASKQHNIPIGALVELDSGARLFVVHHGRDYDMTPLYYMSYDSTDIEQRRKDFKNPGWTGGWPEDALSVVEITAPSAAAEQSDKIENGIVCPDCGARIAGWP